MPPQPWILPYRPYCRECITFRIRISSSRGIFFLPPPSTLPKFHFLSKSRRYRCLESSILVMRPSLWINPPPLSDKYSANFCDKFYVRSDISKGRFCAMQNTIKDQDIYKSKMIGQSQGSEERPYFF